MSRIERIKNSLSELKPNFLKIDDKTVSHYGHISSEAQETHLAITIFAECLLNKNKVEQHRIINDLLYNEFNIGLHALTINVLVNPPIE